VTPGHTTAFMKQLRTSQY